MWTDLWTSFVEFAEGAEASAIANSLEAVGFVFTCIGLAFTYMAARKSREAAEQARDAATSAIYAVREVTDLATAVAILEEIMRLQRSGSWEVALDRYLHCRNSLVKMKASATDMSDEDKSKVQMSIQQITNLRNTIEKALHSKSGFDTSRYNKILTTQIGSLGEVSVSMHSKFVRRTHG